jgi:hypothetical protein
VLLALELGRLRNARHTDVSRQRRSGFSAMARRYFSRPARRDSVSSGEEAVDLNQDFEGRGEGGGSEIREVREEWRDTKSE